jgi:flagellar basal body-associated protein FliL
MYNSDVIIIIIIVIIIIIIIIITICISLFICLSCEGGAARHVTPASTTAHSGHDFLLLHLAHPA